MKHVLTLFFIFKAYTFAGDLAALNTSTSAHMGGLQSLLGAQALLQNQQAFLPSLPGALGMQFFQGQSILQGGQRSNNQVNPFSFSFIIFAALYKLSTG